MLTESQMQAFKSLRETVSSDMNYHKYRLELRNIHVTPCIPCLCELLGNGPLKIFPLSIAIVGVVS